MSVRNEPWQAKWTMSAGRRPRGSAPPSRRSRSSTAGAVVEVDGPRPTSDSACSSPGPAMRPAARVAAMDRSRRSRRICSAFAHAVIDGLTETGAPRRARAAAPTARRGAGPSARRRCRAPSPAAQLGAAAAEPTARPAETASRSSAALTRRRRALAPVEPMEGERDRVEPPADVGGRAEVVQVRAVPRHTDTTTSRSSTCA